MNYFFLALIRIIQNDIVSKKKLFIFLIVFLCLIFISFFVYNSLPTKLLIVSIKTDSSYASSTLAEVQGQAHEQAVITATDKILRDLKAAGCSAKLDSYLWAIDMFSAKVNLCGYRYLLTHPLVNFVEEDRVIKLDM